MAVPKRVTKPMPLRGRHTSLPGDALGDDFSPNALNVRFRFGEVRPAPGRGLFDRQPVAEPVLKIGEFGLSTDVRWVYMLTTSKLFRRGNLNPFDTDRWIETTGTVVPGGTARWSTASGEDHLFFCRGADSLLQWDGSSAHQFDLVKNVAGFEPVDGVAGVSPSPKFLEYFADRIVCANVSESGVIFSNRLRWPERGDFRKWDSTKGLGAGFLDLQLEFSEPITGLKALGDRLVVYSPHTIAEVVETGDTDPAFISKIRARSVGCPAGHTIGKADQVHFFLGHDFNVWAWDGVQVQRVGEPVWKELLALGHSDSVEVYFGFISHHRREYWLVLSDPVRGTFEAFIYDYSTGSWSRDTFPSLMAADEVELVIHAKTWNDLIGTWDDQNFTWESLGGTEQSTLLGGRNDGSTMVIDEQYGYDYFAIGSIMDCILETGDMYCPEEGPWKMQEILRVLMIYDPTTAGNTPFEVGVSFDEGRNWTTRDVTPVDCGFSYADFVLSGQKVRYRFREKGAGVAFRWRSFGYQYVMSGDVLPCGLPPGAAGGPAGALQPLDAMFLGLDTQLVGANVYSDLSGSNYFQVNAEAVEYTLTHEVTFKALSWKVVGLFDCTGATLTLMDNDNPTALFVHATAVGFFQGTTPVTLGPGRRVSLKVTSFDNPASGSPEVDSMWTVVYNALVRLLTCAHGSATLDFHPLDGNTPGGALETSAYGWLPMDLTTKGISIRATAAAGAASVILRQDGTDLGSVLNVPPGVGGFFLEDHMLPKVDVGNIGSTGRVDRKVTSAFSGTKQTFVAYVGDAPYARAAYNAVGLSRGPAGPWPMTQDIADEFAEGNLDTDHSPYYVQREWRIPGNFRRMVILLDAVHTSTFRITLRVNAADSALQITTNTTDTIYELTADVTVLDLDLVNYRVERLTGAGGLTSKAYLIHEPS